MNLKILLKKSTNISNKDAILSMSKWFFFYVCVALIPKTITEGQYVGSVRLYDQTKKKKLFY